MDTLFSSVLLVSPPSRLRDGLRAILRALPQLGAITAVDHPRAAHAYLQHNLPGLVLLDAAFPDEESVAALQNFLRRAMPEVGLIVLAENGRQMAQAQHAQADWVLLKGFTVPALQEALQSLLPFGYTLALPAAASALMKEESLAASRAERSSNKIASYSN